MSSKDNPELTDILLEHRVICRTQRLCNPDNNNLIQFDGANILSRQVSVHPKILVKRLSNGTVSTIGSDEDVGMVDGGICAVTGDACIVLTCGDDPLSQNDFAAGDMAHQDRVQLRSCHNDTVI